MGNLPFLYISTDLSPKKTLPELNESRLGNFVKEARRSPPLRNNVSSSLAIKNHVEISLTSAKVYQSWHFKSKKDIIEPNIDIQNKVLEDKRKAMLKLLHAKRAPNAKISTRT